MPSASSHAILACLKQKSLVDDKIKGRHGNRDFFSLRCGDHGEKHEGNIEEGNGMKRGLVRDGEGRLGGGSENETCRILKTCDGERE